MPMPDIKPIAKLYGGPLGTLVAGLFLWGFNEKIKEEPGSMTWLITITLSIGAFWTFLAILGRIPGSYRWLPFGAVEAVPLVLVARKEKGSLADVLPLLQAQIEEHLLAKKNPRLVIHFHGFNGAVFPIKLSSSLAKGHLATPPSEVFPSGVEARFTNAEVIERGSVFNLELSVALTDESAKMLQSVSNEHNYIELHFDKVQVSVSTVGGLDDSVRHQLEIADSIQLFKGRPTDFWQDKFDPPY